MEAIIKQSYHFKDFTTEFEQCDFSKDADFTVLFIHGLKATPWIRKANMIKEFCKKNSLNFRRYELIGHGSDEKNFLRCDFELWKDQLRDIIANHIAGSVIIVGHCVGGWLGLSIAEEYPDRIKAFLGLAVAPDLIEQLLDRSTLEQRQMLADTGFVEAQVDRCHYVFSQRLWTNLHVNDLLQKDTINVTCPVHLIHGQRDNFVNWHSILKLADKIAYDKTVVKILKNGNHHLQDSIAIREMEQSLLDVYLEAKMKKF